MADVNLVSLTGNNHIATSTAATVQNNNAGHGQQYNNTGSGYQVNHSGAGDTAYNFNLSLTINLIVDGLHLDQTQLDPTDHRLISNQVNLVLNRERPASKGPEPINSAFCCFQLKREDYSNAVPEEPLEYRIASAVEQRIGALYNVPVVVQQEEAPISGLSGLSGSGGDRIEEISLTRTWGRMKPPSFYTAGRVFGLLMHGAEDAQSRESLRLHYRRVVVLWTKREHCWCLVIQRIDKENKSHPPVEAGTLVYDITAEPPQLLEKARQWKSAVAVDAIRENTLKDGDFVDYDTPVLVSTWSRVEDLGFVNEKSLPFFISEARERLLGRS